MASVASRLRPLPGVRSLPSSFVLPAVVLVVLLAVSLVLRTDSLGESLWMDEGLSIGIASQPLFDIPLMFATLVTIAMVGIVLYLAVVLVERRLVGAR